MIQSFGKLNVADKQKLKEISMYLQSLGGF